MSHVLRITTLALIWRKLREGWRWARSLLSSRKPPEKLDKPRKEVNQMPEIGDIVEMIVDYPERHLRMGIQGTIVHCHSHNHYEVEFTNENGETLDFLALSDEQFVVVWQAKTQAWVTISEQTAAIVKHLPENTAREVLDFARFLSLKHHLTNQNMRHQIPG